MTEHEAGKLVSDMDHVKQTLDKMANDMKTYIAGQDGRQNSRDRECAIHTSEINVLKNEQKNQGDDIQILFTNQRDIKTKLEGQGTAILANASSIYRFVAGSILIGILALSASVFAAVTALGK